MTRVWSFVLLGRPLFLTGGFLLYGLGVLMALVNGAPLKLPVLLWGQLAVTAGQLMTHYGNEYFDLQADRANPTPTRWAGGSSILPTNQLHPQVALRAALFFACLGLTAGLVVALTIRPGLLAVLIMLGGMILAWSYSAPPVQLHSRGLGESTVALVVAGLTPLLGYVLQTGRIDALPLLAIVPLLFLQFAMMLVLELPDAAGDTAVGKGTLVVRLGPAGAVRLHHWAVFSAYFCLPLLVWLGLPVVVAAAASFSGAVAWWQARRLTNGAWARPEAWDSLGFWAIGLLVGTAGLEVMAFLWLFQNN